MNTANTEGLHVYIGTSTDIDIRNCCVNFLCQIWSKDPNYKYCTPKLIKVNTEKNLCPADATTLCHMRSYVLCASRYKQFILHLEDNLICIYQAMHGELCLNHGALIIQFNLSPPSGNEPLDIYWVYLTVLSTEKAI